MTISIPPTAGVLILLMLAAFFILHVWFFRWMWLEIRRGRKAEQAEQTVVEEESK